METTGVALSVLGVLAFAVGAVFWLFGFMITVTVTAENLLNKRRFWKGWDETSQLWAGGIVSAIFGAGMLALMAAAKFLHTL